MGCAGCQHNSPGQQNHMGLSGCITVSDERIQTFVEENQKDILFWPGCQSLCYMMLGHLGYNNTRDLKEMRTVIEAVADEEWNQMLQNIANCIPTVNNRELYTFVNYTTGSIHHLGLPWLSTNE